MAPADKAFGTRGLASPGPLLGASSGCCLSLRPGSPRAQDADLVRVVTVTVFDVSVPLETTTGVEWLVEHPFLLTDAVMACERMT